MGTELSDPTGRLLIADVRRDGGAFIEEFGKATGLRLAPVLHPSEGEPKEDVRSKSDGVYLASVGVAVVQPRTDEDRQKIVRLPMMQAAAKEFGGSVVEPEGWVHLIGQGPTDYARGLRDAADLVARQSSDQDDAPVLRKASIGETWGLRETHVAGLDASLAPLGSGAGVRVAILDTGLDRFHPDFVGRTIVRRSFGEAGDSVFGDVIGHGTHVTGTACGALAPAMGGKRYGIAFDADIYVGKVFNDETGRARDGDILEAIGWAMAQKCAVINLSLGRPAHDSSYSLIYETVAKVALATGTLIVAAAGNDYVLPVSHPANCPSIMAVGAVDEALLRAPFSNMGLFSPQGAVDIAAPGVNVYSTYPLIYGAHATMEGTSMAAPHVTGIAALYASLDPDLRGQALWQRLVDGAKPLALPKLFAGAGLVQAPTFRRVSWPGWRDRFPG